MPSFMPTEQYSQKFLNVKNLKIYFMTQFDNFIFKKLVAV